MKTILVVDDDPGILGALKLVLSESGYKVIAVRSEEELVASLKKTKPDVIILDILLSGSDGRDICKKLKAAPKTKKIPIIIFSAHPAAKDDVFKYGADDFLSKPFEVETLLLKVRKFTE